MRGIRFLMAVPTSSFTFTLTVYSPVCFGVITTDVLVENLCTLVHFVAVECLYQTSYSFVPTPPVDAQVAVILSPLEIADAEISEVFSRSVVTVSGICLVFYLYTYSIFTDMLWSYTNGCISRQALCFRPFCCGRALIPNFILLCTYAAG